MRRCYAITAAQLVARPATEASARLGAVRRRVNPRAALARARAADRPRAFLTVAMSLYVAVIVGRIAEVIPILGRLYLGKVSALLLIVALVMEGPQLHLVPALKTTTAKCIGLITLIALLSVPGSFWPGYSVGFLKNVWPLMVLLGVGVLACFGDRRIAYACLASLVAVTGLAAIELVLGGGLVQASSLSVGGSGPSEARAYIGTAESSTYDSNYTAALFVTMLPYAIMFASRRGKMRWVAFLFVPALALALIKTGSRGGIVAMAVLVASMVFFADKKHRKRQIGILACGVVAMFLAPHAELAQRLQSLVSGDDYNFSAPGGRWEIWGNGLTFLVQHPIAGVGVGAFEVANGTTFGTYLSAHNAWVQIAAELGVVGVGSFIAMIWLAFKFGWWKRRALLNVTPLARGDDYSFDLALITAAICSLIAELTAAMFLSLAYEGMTIFALTVPVALALSRGFSVTAPATRQAGLPKRYRQSPGTAVARSQRSVRPGL
jgi:O-antigen ligase